MTTTTSEPGSKLSADATLQEQARRHLWMHFTRMGEYSESNEIPIIVRGEGPLLRLRRARQALPRRSRVAVLLAALAPGCADWSRPVPTRSRTLAILQLHVYAHPRTIELATRVAELTPGDLNRVFFTNSWQRKSVEAAPELARPVPPAHRQATPAQADRAEIAYHGTTFGAMTATGIPDYRIPFEPLLPGVSHVPNTSTYRFPENRDPLELAEAFAERIEFEGPETVAAVIMEPVQNAGGCLLPPAGYFDRVREICDEYDVLLISDEVICSWGRLGTYFGSQRLGYQPDIITTAKGLTSAYAPMGAMIASDRVAEPFMQGTNSFLHGATWGGHPVAAAIALANLDAFENEDIIGHVRANEGAFRAMLDSLSDLPIVGEVRGMGYFYAIELVKDKETKESFTDEESETLLRGYLSSELFERGLICRSDDRGDPVVQLSPPLIAGQQQFDEIHAVLRPVLEEAGRRMNVRNQ